MDIFQAARVGDCSQIQQNIAQLNSANEDGDTALLLAAKAGHRNAVDMLIRAGASVNAIDKKGMNSTLASLRNNDIAIFKLLLDNGADPNSRSPSTDKSTLLVEAAYRGRDEMVTLLLAHGAIPDTINEYGDSALLWACKHGCLDSAKALLDAGANPSHTNKNGKSIHSFAKGDSMVQLLTTYQKGGPSWLARELSAQGLSWNIVCDVEAKLVREGFVSQSVIANTPLSAFTDAALKSVGVAGMAVRAMVRDVRLRATWLGERLASHSVRADSLEICEDVILVKYNCTTPALFAALLPADLFAPVLSVYGLKPRNVGAMLRDLHSELCAEFAASTMGTATTTATSNTITTTNTTTTATTSNSTAAVLNNTSVHVCTSDGSFYLSMVWLWTVVLAVEVFLWISFCTPVVDISMAGFTAAVVLTIAVAVLGLILTVAKFGARVTTNNTTAATDASTRSIPTTAIPTAPTATTTTAPTTAALTAATTTTAPTSTTDTANPSSAIPVVATTTIAPTFDPTTTTTDNTTTTSTANTTAVSTTDIAAVTVAAGVALTAVAVLGLGVCAAHLLRPDASNTSTSEDTAGDVTPSTTANTSAPAATSGASTTLDTTTVVSTSNTTQAHTSAINTTTSNTTTAPITAHTTPTSAAVITTNTASTTTAPTTTTGAVTPAADRTVTLSTATSPAEAAAVALYHTGTLRPQDEWRRVLEQAVMEDYLAHLRTNTSTSTATASTAGTTDTNSTITTSDTAPICVGDTTTPVAALTKTTTATTNTAPTSTTNTTPSVSTASITAAATDTTTAESTPAVVAANTTDTSSATSAATTTTAAPTSATLIPPATNIDTTSIVNTLSTAASAAEAAAVALYFYGPGNELVTDLLTGTLRPKDECRRAMELSLMEDYATSYIRENGYTDSIVDAATSSTTAGTPAIPPDSCSTSSVTSDVDTPITASTATTALTTDVPITSADCTPATATAVTTARDCFGRDMWAVRDYHTGAVLPEAQGQHDLEQLVNSY